MFTLFHFGIRDIAYYSNQAYFVTNYCKMSECSKTYMYIRKKLRMAKLKQGYIVHYIGRKICANVFFLSLVEVTRVVGNKKGLLTRQRQPKMAAHLIRDRYHSIMTGQFTCRL